MVCTPGASVNSAVKFRPFSGRSRIWVGVTSEETAAVRVSTCAASPTTVTVSVCAPVGSMKSATGWPPTVNVIPVRTTVWKPVEEARTSYSPTGRSGMLYRPCEAVTADCVIPVPRFLTTIAAAADAAPELSVAVPEMVAVLPCASRRFTPTTMIRIRTVIEATQNRIKLRISLLDIYSPFIVHRLHVGKGSSASKTHSPHGGRRGGLQERR